MQGDGSRSWSLDRLQQSSLESRHRGVTIRDRLFCQIFLDLFFTFVMGGSTVLIIHEVRIFASSPDGWTTASTFFTSSPNTIIIDFLILLLEANGPTEPIFTSPLSLFVIRNYLCITSLHSDGVGHNTKQPLQDQSRFRPKIFTLSVMPSRACLFSHPIPPVSVSYD